ncbi:MAG TPA: hypothetical protein VK550_22655 [Polyangiaceae bacterium]|nr:hypothetical protein [Polyangiaceae bacterium]
MKSDDVLRALRAEQNLATRELAHDVFRHVLGSVKTRRTRHLPISPVEAQRIRGVCLTLLAALDAAEQVAPSHFELIKETAT